MCSELWLSGWIQRSLESFHFDILSNNWTVVANNHGCENIMVIKFIIIFVFVLPPGVYNQYAGNLAGNNFIIYTCFMLKIVCVFFADLFKFYYESVFIDPHIFLSSKPESNNITVINYKTTYICNADRRRSFLDLIQLRGNSETYEKSFKSAK